MNLVKEIEKNCLAAQESCFALADEIWEYAETAYHEFRSVKAQITLLRREGFAVQENTAGIPTAFTASYGTGGPHIGILGEYDALSGLSQKADALTQEPLVAGGSGHGCGHNLLGGGSVLAAVLVKRVLQQNNLPGRITYFGCPAEEGGSGKAFMVRDGVFEDLDAALCWHPGPANSVMSTGTLANIQKRYSFHGRSAHASAAPHMGRSAMDAVELMNVGANYLREHIIPEARIHYAVTNTGSSSPNVIPDYAEVVYLVRAPLIKDCREILRRVDDVASGAALMSGTGVTGEFMKACSNFIVNDALSRLMDECLSAFPLPQYTALEKERAEAYRKSAPDNSEMLFRVIRGMCGPEKAALLQDKLKEPLMTFRIPYAPTSMVMPASTDVGDVSNVCPAAQLGTVTCAYGTPEHSWQTVAQGKSSTAHKGMALAAKALSLTALRLMEDQVMLDKVKREFKAKADPAFISPIPDGVQAGPIA